MVVTFTQEDHAVAWISTDSALGSEGTIIPKSSKKVDLYVSYDNCRTCRLKNCNTNGRKCSGIFRCAKCLGPNCKNYHSCKGQMKCIHCKVIGSHTSGSSKCPVNREYAKKKRTQIEDAKKQNELDKEVKNTGGEALHKVLKEVKKGVEQANKTLATYTCYAEAVKGVSSSPTTTIAPTSNKVDENNLTSNHIRHILLTAAYVCKGSNYNQDAYKEAIVKQYELAQVTPPPVYIPSREVIDNMWPDKIGNHLEWRRTKPSNIPKIHLIL